MAFLDYELPHDLIAQEPAAERDRSRLLSSAVAPAHSNIAGSSTCRTCSTPATWSSSTTRECSRPASSAAATDRRQVGGALPRRARRRLGNALSDARHACPGETVVVAVPGADLPRDRTPGAAASNSAGLRLKYQRVRQTDIFYFVPNRPARPTLYSPATARFRCRRTSARAAAATADGERYQTVFARQPGSIAAPTAGLHFTPQVFERLREHGIATTTF